MGRCVYLLYTLCYEWEVQITFSNHAYISSFPKNSGKPSCWLSKAGGGGGGEEEEGYSPWNCVGVYRWRF